MHALELIARGMPESDKLPLPCDPVEAVCCVTGGRTLCVPRGHVIKKSNTNSDVLAAPQSAFASVDAYQALGYKWERGSCWIASERLGFERVKRIDIRGLVLSGIGDRGAWAGYLTTSYKKHGGLFAPVNSGEFGVWQFEQERVDCRDNTLIRQWYSRLEQEIRTGLPRVVIESVEAGPYLIRKIGLPRWIDFERWAKPKRQSALYRFLIQLLPTLEERKRDESQ